MPHLTPSLLLTWGVHRSRGDCQLATSPLWPLKNTSRTGLSTHFLAGKKTNLLVDNHKLSPFDDVLTTINPFVGWWYYQISNHQPNNRYVCVYKIVLYIHVYIYIYLHHLVIKSFKSHHFPRSKSSQSFVDQPGIGRTTIPFWQQNLPIISSQFVRLCLAKFKRCRSPSSWFSMCKHSPGVW